MNTNNFHHSTAIRTSIDSRIVRLLPKVIETHITNVVTCESASGALSQLLIKPSIISQINSFSHFILTDKLSQADIKIARKAMKMARESIDKRRTRQTIRFSLDSICSEEE